MILLRTVKGVVFNPVIFMTILGLIVNIFVSYALKKSSADDKLPGILMLVVVGGGQCILLPVAMVTALECAPI
jgi:hypothetical protein